MTLIEQINDLYKQANERYETDEDFRRNAHKTVLEIQNGNHEQMRRFIASVGIADALSNYRKLGVKMGFDDIKGESFYGGAKPIAKCEVIAAMAVDKIGYEFEKSFNAWLLLVERHKND